MRWLAIALLLLGGCASRPAPEPPLREQPVPEAPPAAPAQAPGAKQPALPHYRCDHDIAFDVHFADASAELVFATHESETLPLDAGGVTPQQTVYSSTKLKAEFGLDRDGRGAKLNFADPPLEARCRRD